LIFYFHILGIFADKKYNRERFLLKIYTGFGDRGKTRLYGGKIVDKDNLRVEAYGTIDELNSVIGLVITYIEIESLIKDLQGIQNGLFELSAELATPDENKKTSAGSSINEQIIKELEKKIDIMDNKLDPLKNFILPGGSRGAAFCHLARTICRRAERVLVTLNKEELISPQIIIYINRLSDFLFVVARFINNQQNVADLPWIKG